jgi:uncharacterized protein (DUF952 family)
MAAHELIYHVCAGADWRAAEQAGQYTGSLDDARDGFIHFSTRAQAFTRTEKHRPGQAGLLLLTVRVADLGAALAWEPSRGGQLFPHLYGPLPAAAVAEVTELPLDAGGSHIFPPGFAAAEN